MIKKITIVGGGAAGWLTALYVKKQFPESSITLIESSEVGILGAGEGTTPTFVEFLNNLDISITDVIKYTNATYKNGIKFTNWSGDGTSYFHSFGTSPQFEYSTDKNMSSIERLRLHYNHKYLIELEQISQSKNMDEVDISAVASNENKIMGYMVNGNPNLKSTYAIHFDAKLLAEYFKNIAISRGINLIDAKVVNIENDETGKVSKLYLDNDEYIETDFVFDCSGFARLVIGNHYNSEWRSYKEILPVDTAITFMLPNDDDFVPPFTEAIAMKHGWIWKIPVGNRYGCGYVYDSFRATPDQVHREIVELVGQEVEILKTFSFEPGCYTTPWVKNVVAIGLSAGFVEPLEATTFLVIIRSLAMAIDILKKTMYFQDGQIDKDDEDLILYYNNLILNINNQIKEFIYYHYITKRIDTDFWQSFHEESRVLTKLKKELNLKNLFDFDNDLFYRTALNHKIFSKYSHLVVGAGLKFFDTGEASVFFNSLINEYGEHKYNINKNKLLEGIQQKLSLCTDHGALLNEIKFT
jgi:tryptophan halogenase